MNTDGLYRTILYGFDAALIALSCIAIRALAPTTTIQTLFLVGGAYWLFELGRSSPAKFIGGASIVRHEQTSPGFLLLRPVVKALPFLVGALSGITAAAVAGLIVGLSALPVVWGGQAFYDRALGLRVTSPRRPVTGAIAFLVLTGLVGGAAWHAQTMSFVSTKPPIAVKGMQRQLIRQVDQINERVGDQPGTLSIRLRAVKGRSLLSERVGMAIRGSVRTRTTKLFLKTIRSDFRNLMARRSGQNEIQFRITATGHLVFLNGRDKPFSALQQAGLVVARHGERHLNERTVTGVEITGNWHGLSSVLREHSHIVITELDLSYPKQNVEAKALIVY